MAYEYVLVDKDGRSREYFTRKSDALKEARRLEGAREGATAGWMVLTYDDDGEAIGEPEWVDDLLATPVAPKRAIQFVMQGERVGLFMPAALEGSSGTGTPIRHGFRRPPSDAIRTLVPAEA